MSSLDSLVQGVYGSKKTPRKVSAKADFFMAYNHNSTPLLKKPATSFAVANRELCKYEKATGNAGGYVARVSF